MTALKPISKDLYQTVVTLNAIGEDYIGRSLIESSVLDVFACYFCPSSFSVGISTELLEEVKIDSVRSHGMPI
jgi:hypothetical protein